MKVCWTFYLLIAATENLYKKKRIKKKRKKKRKKKKITSVNIFYKAIKITIYYYIFTKSILQFINNLQKYTYYNQL